MKWQAMLWIGAGGGLGSIGRAWIGLVLPHEFPWATLLVNVAGSFVLGFVVGFDLPLEGQAPRLHTGARDFFVIGFCGGFTTFSTFSYQTLQQLQNEQHLMAGLNIAASLAGALVAVWLGFRSGRWLAG